MTEPDEIDLELLRLGAIDDPEEAARIEAAARGPLAGADADIAIYRSYWKAHRAPLLAPEAPASPWWRSRWVPVLAMAALVLLLLRTTLQAPQPDEVRPMGGLPIDLVTMRQGQPLPDLTSFHTGDQLRVALVPPHDGYLDVATVEADGSVSLLVVGQQVRAGERFALAGAIRLDDTGEREWLVVELVERPRSEGATESAFRGLLPTPSASGTRWVQEVTRKP